MASPLSGAWTCYPTPPHSPTPRPSSSPLPFSSFRERAADGFARHRPRAAAARSNVVCVPGGVGARFPVFCVCLCFSGCSVPLASACRLSDIRFGGERRKRGEGQVSLLGVCGPVGGMAAARRGGGGGGASPAGVGVCGYVVHIVRFSLPTFVPCIGRHSGNPRRGVAPRLGRQRFTRPRGIPCLEIGYPTITSDLLHPSLPTLPTRMTTVLSLFRQLCWTPPNPRTQTSLRRRAAAAL